MEKQSEARVQQYKVSSSRSDAVHYCFNHNYTLVRIARGGRGLNFSLISIKFLSVRKCVNDFEAIKMFSFVRT